MKFHSIRSVFELFLQRNIDQELLVTSKKISRSLYLKKQLLPLCHIMTGIERMCLQKNYFEKNLFFVFSNSQLIFTWFGTFGKLAGYFDVKIAIMISYSYNYYPPLCLSNIRVSNSRNETFYLENKFLHWKKLIWGIFSRVNWAKKYIILIFLDIFFVCKIQKEQACKNNTCFTLLSFSIFTWIQQVNFLQYDLHTTNFKFYE